MPGLCRVWKYGLENFDNDKGPRLTKRGPALFYPAPSQQGSLCQSVRGRVPPQPAHFREAADIHRHCQEMTEDINAIDEHPLQLQELPRR